MSNMSMEPTDRRDCGICKGSHLRLEAEAPHPDWENLTTYILAQVEDYHGTKPHQFLAEGHIEFPNRERTQTGIYLLFPTEAAAEAEARHFFEVMRPIWEEAVWTRMVPESPFTRRQRACEAHVAVVTQAQREACERADVAWRRKDHGYVGYDRSLCDAYFARKMEWEHAVRAAERAFYQAHPWTEFIEAPKPGQLDLFAGAGQ